MAENSIVARANKANRVAGCGRAFPPFSTQPKSLLKIEILTRFAIFFKISPVLQAVPLENL
jgi:hypothetical protein